MATKDPARKFAEQALHIERVLDARDVTGDVGRVVFILAAAHRSGGATQKELVESTSLPKDVVSKLVGSLVRAGFLDQTREDGNARIKRLTTTATGKQVLSEIQAALQLPSAQPIQREKPVKRNPFLWDYKAAE